MIRSIIRHIETIRCITKDVGTQRRRGIARKESFMEIAAAVEGFVPDGRSIGNVDRFKGIINNATECIAANDCDLFKLDIIDTVSDSIPGCFLSGGKIRDPMGIGKGQNAVIQEPD